MKRRHYANDLAAIIAVGRAKDNVSCSGLGHYGCFAVRSTGISVSSITLTCAAIV